MIEIFTEDGKYKIGKTTVLQRGKRSVERLRTRWINNVQKDLQYVGIDNWREVSTDRD